MSNRRGPRYLVFVHYAAAFADLELRTALALRGLLLYTLSYALEALRRLTVAVDGVARVVAMFESQGYDVGRGSELKEKRKALPDIINALESFNEELEWQDLELTAPPSSTIRAVADYLKSTGQASA